MLVPGARFRVLIVLASMLAAACQGLGCESESPASRASPPPSGPLGAEPDAAPSRPKIVVLGDSLTAGYGLVESESFPARLQERVDSEGYEFHIVNAGVSGDTSAGGLRRLDWMLDDDVRVVIVALGANDGLRGLSVAEMQRNLREIISRARARNAVVILGGMEAPPNYGKEYAAAFRQAFRDTARSERVLFIPFLLDKVAGQSALNQADGIHPNAAGARIVADTVWTVLRPLLDQMTGSS